MKTNIKLFNFYIAVAALLFTACSDQFLQDKKNYDNATTEIYNHISRETLRNTIAAFHPHYAKR